MDIGERVMKVGDFVIAHSDFDSTKAVGRIIRKWSNFYCAIYFGIDQVVHFRLEDVHPAVMTEEEKMLWILENE